MDGISELPCPHKRRLVRIRRPNTQDMEDLMVQQTGQVYLTTPYRQPPENDFCSKVDCLYCHRLRMQKLLKPSPWPRGDHLTPRHTHYHAPVLPIIKQGRCLIKRRSLKTPRSRRKATVIHLPPLTGETMTVHRAKGGGLPWWATKTPLGGISWVNADVTEPSTATDGIKLSAVANGEVLHLEEIRLEETKGDEGTERGDGNEEGEDKLEALKEHVLPDISDESSVRSVDTVVSKDTGIGTATAFSEEVTLPSLSNIKVFRLKEHDDTDETSTTDETASFNAEERDGMEDDNRGNDSEITDVAKAGQTVVAVDETRLDEDKSSKQHPLPPHEMDGELICTKEGCSCPYNKDSPQKQSPETSSLTDLRLAHQNADDSTPNESAASRPNGDDFDGKKNELDTEESDLDREGCSNSDEEREAEDDVSVIIFIT
ncbi:PREDICTED: uncharacterized protein LOC109462604 [Branchiostoma belcheri]|uniref:Uncharacterized protein LOC109462604 n=1 Tax=Branchiostoma belcheri TaxID=7741 RepID=A0A6P4YCU4_BRABE|nr:PREDICTED: uncharacterized protein LOC109462604 [Branchiostoma belcheri]